MKNFRNALIISILAFSFLAMTEDKPMKIIFFGDSITQAGVSPNGYITKMNQAIEKQGLKDKYELIGAGIGGNKVYDLFFRLEDDVLLKKPDLVFIFVGVNDVWHKASFGTGSDPDKFEKFYVGIIKKIQANGAKVICCTPACIGEKTDFSNQQDGDLNQYSQIIRNIAAKTNCQVCDLRKEFLAYNLKNNPENKEKGILTTDRVHLNELGNQTVADLMLKMILK